MTTTEAIEALRYMANRRANAEGNTLWLISNCIEAIADDTARLDWLEDTQTDITSWSPDYPHDPSKKLFVCSGAGNKNARPTIRQAIDAAMQATAKK